MAIDSVSSALRDPIATAADGLRDAEVKIADATEEIASGNLDPAVVLDITEASTQFAASAKVINAAQENSKRLLDMLA